MPLSDNFYRKVHQFKPFFKVKAYATINGNAKWQLREISAQTGFGSQNDMRAHFGLGNALIVAQLRIEWPSGIVQTFTNVPVDRILTVAESATAQSLTITAPNGGETWLIGGTQNITWTSSNAGSNVQIEYSTDSGASWTVVVASTANDGSYPWTIPNTPSGTCLVRVTDTDGLPSDQSNVVFTISLLPDVTVTAPNGGEDWAVGSVHNITWTSSGTSGTVKIDYSVDNGTNWSAVTASTTDNGSYAWTVPNNPSTNCLVRITDTDGSPVDQSESTFTITLIQISDLRASVSGQNILLEWSAANGAANYNVYRGTSYDFVPDKAGGSNRIGTQITDEDAGTPGIQWTDTGNGADVVGDVNNNYCYRVTALIPAQSLETDASNLAAEFDYSLVTTAGTDINEIVVLMNTLTTRNPITDAEQLAQAVPNCTDVYYWDAAGQGTVGHVKGLPFNIFPITPGYPYIANVTSPTVWTVAGSYSTPIFGLVTTSSTDINHLAVPLEKAALATAEALGDDIPGCTDVYYWDAPGQGTVGHVVGLPFGDFSVLDGYPYYANVTAATSWPAGAGMGALASLLKDKRSPLAPTNGLTAGGGVPHTVYGKLALSNNLEIEKDTFKIRAWIVGRPNEILTEENIGVGCDGQYWWIGVSNFPTKWHEGDILCAEVTCEKLGLQSEAKVNLTSAGSNYAGEIHLADATSVTVKDLAEMPEGFELKPNYPNPFNPETVVTFGLPKTGHVRLQIYDMSGRLVRTLLNEAREPGYHQVMWNGRDDSDRRVSSAIYFCVMESANNRQTIKLVLAK